MPGSLSVGDRDRQGRKYFIHVMFSPWMGMAMIAKHCCCRRAECQHSLQPEQSHSRDRFHRSSHSPPHSLWSCSCMVCVQPAPLLMRSKELLRNTSSCSGKTLLSPTQLQHGTIKGAAAPFPPIALPLTCLSLDPGFML